MMNSSAAIDFKQLRQALMQRVGRTVLLYPTRRAHATCQIRGQPVAVGDKAPGLTWAMRATARQCRHRCGPLRRFDARSVVGNASAPDNEEYRAGQFRVRPDTLR